MGKPLGVTAAPGVVAAILQLAARQYGLLTRRQWLDAGLSASQLERALKGGSLRAVHRGVYSVIGSRPCFERDVLAACLAVGGVASHQCAAYLWKFRKFERPVVEVLVAKGHAPKLPGVMVRRTVRLDGADRTHIGKIPVTSRARTLLDLVPLAPNRIEGALDGVLHRRPRDLRAMAQLLERAGRNHPGNGFLTPLVAARLAGRRPTESELEDDFLALIRSLGLPEPEPQYPYRGRRIDFAYAELVLGIEIQSVEAHAAKEDIQRNAERANDLLEWWLLYFTYEDVHERPDEVGRRIEDAIALRRLQLAA